ncbi:MAG TPA: pyridoxamine 5'-phosphate oxidase family protein [Candidatus Limnocylindrales bacterium]|nr:pyridoxamine 5'-phosphate oxidase family protein [Candidatus Limnocylindrales bacterium]
MTTWAEFEAAAPELAAAGWELLARSGSGSTDGDGLLATVREDLPPRIHPVSVGRVDGRLYTFVLQSAKLRDLEGDGRYAFHNLLDPEAPDEFMVRGRVRRVAPGSAERASAVAVWSFQPGDTYVLFELEVESAVLGRRGADEWPPHYTTWKA